MPARAPAREGPGALFTGALGLGGLRLEGERPVEGLHRRAIQARGAPGETQVVVVHGARRSAFLGQRRCALEMDECGCGVPRRSST
jgi:hypothetical protein